MSDFDPCSESYVGDYLNDVAVKEAFHASKERQWEHCKYDSTKTYFVIDN
jgi:Serine carboxypeptidase